MYLLPLIATTRSKKNAITYHVGSFPHSIKNLALVLDWHSQF